MSALRRQLAALLAASAVTACGSTISTPSPSSLAALTDTTMLYADKLAAGGSSFFSFATSKTQLVNINLASTMVGPTGPAAPTSLRMGLGVPSGTDCTLSEPAILVAPALTAQIAKSLPPGTYCVRVSDPGAVPDDFRFAARIVLDNEIPTRSSPATELFATSLAVGGTTARTLSASEAGVVQLSLQALDGASAVGIGIGIPRVDGSGCFLTQSVVVSPGAGTHLAASVARGDYCAAVFDAGTLTKPVTFALQIVRP
jgi:hypothetical protein